MGTQLGFYIDQSRCSGCKACVMACKDKNNLEGSRMYRHVTEFCGGSFAPSGNGYTQNVFAYWLSMSCNHCENPACVKNCPTGAMQKRSEDGVVYVDTELCAGCKYCLWNCPYGAPQYNEKEGKMSKCDFCIDLIAEGGDPACVAACPYDAIEYGPIDELREKYGKLADIKGLPSSTITKPDVIIKPHQGAQK